MSRDEFDQDKEYQLWQKQYQSVATEQPPKNLDASIVYAAHQAVNESAKQVQSETGMDTGAVKRAWYVPVSYVAILVISLSVVMKLAFEPAVLQMPVEDVLDIREVEPVDRLSVKTQSTQSVAVDRYETSQKKLLRQEKKSSQVSHRNKQEAAKRKLRHNKILPQKVVAEKQILGVRNMSEPSATIMSESSPENMAASSTAAVAAENELDFNSVNSVNNSTELQQSRINKLMALLKDGQFEKLKAAFKDYREIYPVSKTDSKLPQALLDWEQQNMKNQ